jgi:hypothetical protein
MFLRNVGKYQWGYSNLHCAHTVRSVSSPNQTDRSASNLETQPPCPDGLCVVSLHPCTAMRDAGSQNNVWHSSVGIATGYGLDSRDLVLVRDKKFFSTPQRPYLLWGPPSFLSKGYRGLLFRGGKESGAWNWPLTSIQYRRRKWWSSISTPLCLLTTRLLCSGSWLGHQKAGTSEMLIKLYQTLRHLKTKLLIVAFVRIWNLVLLDLLQSSHLCSLVKALFSLCKW